MAQQYGQVLAHPRPFVKWAGGKRQLIPVLDGGLPDSFGDYYEPFLGGGALLFHMLARHPGRDFRASDLNADLVLAYGIIRDRPGELIESLREHERRYQRDARAHYYSVRGREPEGDVERASRLLFLNRTCFNGLYRVNSSGRFNVPLGRYSRPNIVNEAGIRAASVALSSGRVRIGCGDFEEMLAGAGRGDLVYLDPPYQPVSETASFTGYTSRSFAYGELQRLARLCSELDGRGCRVMLSNSDSAGVTDLFEGPPWRILRVRANRSINSDAGRRSGHHELLIRNY